jgi:hypothetical protein
MANSAGVDSAGARIEEFGEGGHVVTWANESGSIFLIFFTLECRASRIKRDGFGNSLARWLHGED